MTDKTKLPYRLCVGIVLFNKNNDVFVGERIDRPGAWQMPQGGIDSGEEIETAAFRELKEEVGTSDAQILRIAEDVTYYDLPDHLLQKLWNGRYRGQEQRWIAMRFTGTDSDIDLQSFNPPEFQAWKWVPLFKTLDLIVPFKRDTYRKVLSFFEDIAQ